MRALLFDGASARLVRDRAAPQPGPGESLIAPHVAAVTGFDVALVRTRASFRGVLGHAFVGTVESIRGDETGLVGERVVCSTIVRCGTCDLCQAGLRSHCRSRTVIGMEGRDGGLAEQVCVPTANLVRVPPGLDDDRAAFAAPVAAALNAARHLTIDRRPYITVLGDGVLGLLTAQVMVELNATVRLIGRHRDKIALCEKWRIQHRLAGEIGRRQDQDIVVDCTGRPDGLEFSASLVRPRGTVLALSPFAAAPPAPALVLGELKLLGSFGGPIGDALAAITAGEVDVVSLISRRMKLSDGPAVLESAARPEALAVLVDCRS